MRFCLSLICSLVTYCSFSQSVDQLYKQMLKPVIILSLLAFSYSATAQQPSVVKVERQILDAFCKHDTLLIKKLVDDQFLMVRADGTVERKPEFVRAYAGFGPENKLSISVQHDKIIDKGSIVIVHGVVTNQWQEAENSMASKVRYTDTYRKEGSQWLLLSSFLNDIGETYFKLKDTSGAWSAIAKQYELLDQSVEQKDLGKHLSLKTGDFNTVDHLGNFGSPQFMRNRSKILFSVLRDSIDSNNKIEAVEIAGDTARVTVLQTFKRRQVAGGKVRYMQTTARQRESWMLTREGWKLVFVDKVKPLTRIIDGIATDADKPVNWNDPVFKQ